MKLGIAFSGGGIKGATHLGVVKALHENGIKPDIFAGTSAGAIVASLLANDVDPDRALEILKSVCDNIVDVDFLGIIGSIIRLKTLTGIAKGKSLENALDYFFKGLNLTSVSKPLSIVTTDIKTGKQIIFTNKSDSNNNLICDDNYLSIVDTKTPLSYLISASCSLPVIYKPKLYGEFNLVDGGLVNNLPSDIVKAMGAERVISVDLGLSDEVDDPDDVFHMATQSISIFMERSQDNSREDFDILLTPHVRDIHVLDTSRIEECFYRGYDYGKKQVGYILEQLGGNTDV